MTIDTSAVLAVLLNEPTRHDLIRVSKGRELLAPGSLPWEIGNALSALFKKGRLDLAKATQALDSYRQIPVRLVETALDAALDLAWDLQIYAYDAFMLECARRHRAPLMTLDAALQRAAARIDVAVIDMQGGI